MRVSSRILAGAVAASSGLTGACAATSHAARAPTPIPAAPPSPPPVTCATLGEHCLASADTELALGQAGVAFKPPAGWWFARSAREPAAQSPSGQALVAVTLAASQSAHDVTSSVARLAEHFGVEQIELEALEKRLNKPQSTVDDAGTHVSLWEIDASSQPAGPLLREHGPGTALVFVAAFAADQVAVGLGFAVTPEAEDEAARVMESVRSIRGPK